MATFSIYSKNGQNIRYSGEPQYSGSYMGVDYIEFRSVCSPTPIDWERGDYVDYSRTGLRYKLYSLPMPKKIARRGEYGAAFEYNNVQFYSAAKELEIAPFRDIVAEDNNIHFSTRQDISTYEDVYGIARRIQACMDDIFPNRWRIEVFETKDEDLNALLKEVKEFTVNNASCLDALSHIYDTWKNVGWIHSYDEASNVDVITIGRANVRDVDNTSDSYSYGIGRGLTSIKKASANDGEFATRLYVYGSERNIQTRYYNKHNILHKDSVDIKNLMLPIDKWGKTDGLPDARKAYLQADNAIVEKYGLIPRTVYFNGNGNEDIYPSITGLTMSQVRQEMIKAGQSSSEYLPGDYSYRIDQVGLLLTGLDDGSQSEVEKQRTVEICLHEMGFNLAEQGRLTSEGYAVIAMTSGACAGREFKVTKYVGPAYGNEEYGSRTYRIERDWDESLGEGFPNKNYPIKSGDTFVLLEIPMPEFYITMAENRLYAAAEKMLADYTRVSAFYEPGIDSIKIKEGGKLLRAGMYMQVYDEDIIDTADNRDYVLIDSITIDEKAVLPSYKITLREQKRSSRTYSVLEDMIEDAKEDTKEAIKKERQYTDRRFRSAQETLDMLAGAFDDFSDGIDPITIKTMAALIGHETLQFKFTSSIDSFEDIPCPLRYNENTKQLEGSSAALVHMTLGVDDVTVKSSRNIDNYRRWEIDEFYSATLDDTDVAYYVYVKASKEKETAEYVIEEASKAMDSTDAFYFLVGILNSENAGTREFVTLYGFTEILPGQITTDIIRSGNSNLIVDLARAIITAKNGAKIKGSVEIEDGSLISSMLAVGDTSDDEAAIEAFLNGGDLAKDDVCGKLLIAAGIPTTSSDGEDVLEKRAKEATTRVYEDGCIYTKKLHLEDGCSVGALTIVEDAIHTEHNNNGESYITKFSEDGISHTVVKGGVVKRSAEISGCEYYPLSAMVNGVNACHVPFKGSNADGNIDETTMYAALCLDAPNGYSVYAVNGMFAGLRPKSRAVSGATTLDEFDHTIFATSASADITLPSNPQLGQEYVILAPYGGVQIKGNGNNIRLFHDGVVRTGFNCGDVGARTEFRLYWTGTEWWATHTEN